MRALGRAGGRGRRRTWSSTATGWEGLREPADVIDVRNSGTLIRLLPGLVASLPFLCVLTGDASIRRRPMARVLRPLRAMGATVAGREGDHFLRSPSAAARCGACAHELAVASAQVKSCILLAGLRAEGETEVVEPAASRDHTERMIRYAGGRVEREGPAGRPRDACGSGRSRRLAHGLAGRPRRFQLRGVLHRRRAAHRRTREVTVENAGLNPTRTGLLAVLRAHGRRCRRRGAAEAPGPEPVGRITARTSRSRRHRRGGRRGPERHRRTAAVLARGRQGEGRLAPAGGRRTAGQGERPAAAPWPRCCRALGVKVVEHPGRHGRRTATRRAGRAARSSTEADHRVAMVGAIAGAASTRRDERSTTRTASPCPILTSCAHLEALGGR